MFYHNNRMQLPFSIPFVTRDLHVSIISEYSIQRSRTQTSWTYFVRYNQSHYLPACLPAVAPLPVAVSVSKWIYSQQIYQSTLLHFYCDCGLNYYSWCPLETPRDFFAQQHQSLLYDYLSLATKTPSAIHPPQQRHHQFDSPNQQSNISRRRQTISMTPLVVSHCVCPVTASMYTQSTTI